MKATNDSTALSQRDYLERIGAQLYGPPSADQLRHLHQRHLLSVPFENLDIDRGVPIELDEPAILQKVLRARRGGFCYELNTAFAWLLARTGYVPRFLSAEVARPDGGFGIPFDHMLLLVETPQGTYLADVGFGESFRRPLPLRPEHVHEEMDFKFRLKRDRDRWTLERAAQMSLDYTPQYRFTLAPRELSEYESACEFHQTSPQSTFTKGAFVTMARFDGRVTLQRDRLIVRSRRERMESSVETRAQWEGCLVEHFGIALEPRKTTPHGPVTSPSKATHAHQDSR